MIGFGGVIVPIIILSIVLVYTLFTGRALAFVSEPDDLTIKVIGHRYWWEIHYPDHEFTTANEIHIPIGQPVTFRLMSADVIHSFWIPELHGKLELIPGKTDALVIQADEPGVYRGHCGEFCGLQHSLMYFIVVAQPPDEFAAWVANQQRSAAQPTDPTLVRGQQVFLGSACVYCHIIQGTTSENATETVGPDLTHIASRRTLASGVLENNRGNMGGWVIDPQSIKPGNRVPGVNLSLEDLQALLVYLESLE
jgi:cytochrome c oxidase subunit 2